MIKKIVSQLPGFRSNKRWKKTVSIVLYVCIVLLAIVFIGTGDSTVSALDNNVSRWQGFVIFVFLVLIPFILISNLGDIRTKLPLFSNRSVFKKIIAWIFSGVIVLTGLFYSWAALDGMHSTEFIAKKEEQRKDKAIQKQKDKEKKEAEKRVASAKEGKIQRELEERTTKEISISTLDKQLEQQEEDEETLSTVGNQTRQEKVSPEQQPVEINNTTEIEDNTDNESSFSNWFSNFFNSEPEDSYQKTIKEIDKSLKKEKTEKLLEIYNSSENLEIKKYIEERTKEKYIQLLKENKDLYTNQKIDKLEKLYEKINFINGITGIKNSNVGIVVDETQKLIESNKNFVNFQKEHPRLFYGAIKDESEIQTIKGYVGYRIKDADTKIGDLTISTGNYSDSYYISSYSYSELFGYSASEEWGAVLRLSEGSNLSGEGIYETSVVPNGVTKLVDNRGFEKEYPIYREISQTDYDKYYQVKELMQEQDRLKRLISQSTSRILKYL